MEINRRYGPSHHYAPSEPDFPMDFPNMVHRIYNENWHDLLGRMPNWV